MLEAQEIIVLSDLHLGPESGKGLFRSDEELCNCLRWILQKDTECYVILAGDILDFLVLGENETPADFYNLDKVGTRAANIISAHPEVFNAFAELANSQKHHLLYVAGNHDPEVVFPEVQFLIEKKLTATAKPAARWVVHGEPLRMKIGAANVLIEHGNLFDRYNQVDYKKLREVLSLKNHGFSLSGKNYYEVPFGSRLVIDYLSPVHIDFPWLDYLLPMNEAVIPMIRELTSIREKAGFLRTIKDFLWVIGDDEFTKFRANYKPEIAYKSGGEDRFLEWLNEEFEKQNQPKDKGWIIKSNNSKLIAELVSNWKDVSDITLHDSAYEQVAFILEHNANLVITGHTHLAKIYPINQGLYINTGTWGQIMTTPDVNASEEVWEIFIDNLKAGRNWKDESFSRLTFANVKLDSDNNSTVASLVEWKDSAPQPLSNWHWNEDSASWRKSK
jgi:UDP-2,3-diacylglucosamine pyrophosphatase LpxH